MKIEIERSGGFAGIIKTIAVETEDIPKDIASKLEKFFSETADSKSRIITGKKNRMPDCYSYKISSQVGNGKREVKFTEFDTHQKDLKVIIEYLFKTYEKN